MKIFSCQKCQHLAFFENVRCTRCDQTLAYLPDQAIVGALEPEPATDPADPTRTVYVQIDDSQRKAGARRRYRLCQNSIEHGVCNWAIPADSDAALCRACSLNEVIPNLSEPSASLRWQRLEIAKRRLLYTLLALELPVEPRGENGRGLAFAFKGDEEGGQVKVYTGHAQGLITINIAEADDPSREQMRVQMGEAYRTLLGHFRHEVGHYYWDRLVRDSAWLDKCREHFGDERADYAAAQKRHYEQGAPSDWTQHFVSAYASMHPWEDWAETFAHYLHMVDTLETARSYGLALRPQPVGGARITTVSARRLDFDDFEDLISAWFPLTIALNSLNRGMGLPDLYPFVLSDAALKKLRFVHDLIEDGSWDATAVAQPGDGAKSGGEPARSPAPASSG